MKFFPGYKTVQRLTHPNAVTIGNFDGVHLGHQELIRMAGTKALALNGNAIVYTFNPHPQQVLRPDKALPLLLTYEEKREKIRQFGPGMLVEEPFSRDFSTSSAEFFFNEILINHLHAREIVVGYDFSFGKSREGTLEQLTCLCTKAGVSLTVIPALQIDGQTVSSTAIRSFLEKGQISEANQFLGDLFFYQGYVIRGDQRARLLGFPTANIRLEQKIALPFGVYATQTQLENGEMFSSITNVGVRPTFYNPGAVEPIIETHFIDQTIDLYGKKIRVFFRDFIRPERRFSSLEELKDQIDQDIKYRIFNIS